MFDFRRHINHRRSNGAGKGLLPLIFRCSDIDDLRRFAVLATKTSVPTNLIYRPWSIAHERSSTIIEVDMASLSLDQAMMEAEVADVIVADLSRMDAIEIHARQSLALVGPAASLSRLIEGCRATRLTPRFSKVASRSDLTLPLGCQLERPPCTISRIRHVYREGNSDWMENWRGRLPNDDCLPLMYQLEIPLQAC